MSKLDEVRKEYEKADAAAVKLSAEHQGKVDELSAKRQELRDRYYDRIWDANAKAAEAQQRLADYEAAQALLDRGEEGESTLANHTGEGGQRLHAAYADLKADRS